jgi:hypothetical protein
MANTLLTNDDITNEALAVLENEIVFAKKVHRPVDDMFANEDHQNGDSVKIRLPDRGTYRSGATFSADDVTEDSVTVTLSQGGADCNFTTKELTLDIAKFSERILKPRIVTIANEIDRQGLALYDDIANQVGTAGTAPNAATFVLDGGRVLDDEACPRDGQRNAIWSPAHNASLVGGLSTLFNSTGKIGDQYEKGLMGMGALGFDHFMSQNTPSHTVGALGGTPLVNGAAQTGASLITDGWTAAVANRLAVGDVFTIANVYAVNPITGQSTGRLRQFTATAVGASDVAGNMTISISPSIVTTGKFKNVNAAPADNAALTITGTASTAYSTSLLFHPDAFAFAMAQLYLPDGVDKAARKSYNGLSIRMVRAYDVNNDKLPTRLDVLFGWQTARKEWACRVIG